MAVAHDENRPVLTGVHMRFAGEEVTLSSTDRFRLGRASFRWTPTRPISTLRRSCAVPTW